MPDSLVQTTENAEHIQHGPRVNVEGTYIVLGKYVQLTIHHDLYNFFCMHVLQVVLVQVCL